MIAEEYERQARGRLDERIYGFFAGGADDEHTLNENPRSWAGVYLQPRVLRDVSKVATRTSLLGSEVGLPVGVAPMAAQRLLHPEGELASARGAAEAGVLYVLSTNSNASLEEVAGVTPRGPRWFQLYVPGDFGLARELVQRAEASGYGAIVVTVDLPTLGLRRRERNAGWHLQSETPLGNFSSGGVNREHVALTFEDLSTIRSWTGLPVVAKGVLRGDDAAACVRAGAAGIVVSNHGGRQLDTTVPPPTALAEVAAAIGDVAEIYVDGGIRRGTDVLKALALGADGVFVGRPIVWGLAADGTRGVTAVLTELVEEFERAMKLCGAATLDDITPDLVVF